MGQKENINVCKIDIFYLNKKGFVKITFELDCFFFFYGAAAVAY